MASAEAGRIKVTCHAALAHNLLRIADASAAAPVDDAAPVVALPAAGDELVTDILFKLLPPDVSKWSGILENSFVLEHAR